MQINCHGMPHSAVSHKGTPEATGADPRFLELGFIPTKWLVLYILSYSFFTLRKLAHAINRDFFEL